MARFEFYIKDTTDNKYKKVEFNPAMSPLAPYHGKVRIREGESLDSLTTKFVGSNDDYIVRGTKYNASHEENVRNVLNDTRPNNKYDKIKSYGPQANFGYLGDIAHGYLGY